MILLEVKRAAWITGSAIVAGVVGASLVVARQPQTIRESVRVGPVHVGGLTQEDAARKVRLWWETQRQEKLEVVSDLVEGDLPSRTPGMLGVSLDDVASVAQAPLANPVERVIDGLRSTPPDVLQLEPVYKENGQSLADLAKLVAARQKRTRPARVYFASGALVREPEVGRSVLDVPAIPGATITALQSDSTRVELPVKEAPKRVPDEALGQITAVVGEFSTPFAASNRMRSTNLRLAAASFSGQVLMPGDRLSFNETVGERTVAKGYKDAIIFVNGREESGLAGGICQVSTTLYNAALLADLKIVRRSNHSLPVPYVPLGRDATVSYGAVDLVIENNRATPIAVLATYQPGRLKFRFLGKPEPGLEVRIERSDVKTWSRGEKVVRDASLPAGRRRVVEKGANAHSVSTFRIVRQNGAVVRRESLGTSRYSGSPRIVAVGAAKAAASPATTPTTTAPTTAGMPL